MHLVDLQIVVGSKPIRKYFHQGRTIVEARKGTAYTIKLRNLTHTKLLANITVDGLSVMTGKPGDIQSDTGYILGPYQEIEIPGWRINDNTVSKFQFGERDSSYAGQSGSSENCGVIGVAIFREQQLANIVWNPSFVVHTYPAHYYPFWYNTAGAHQHIIGNASSADVKLGTNFGGVISSSNAVLNADSPPQINQVYTSLTSNQVAGTDFGEKSDHSVVSSSFCKETKDPNEVISLEYKFRAEMTKMGIVMDPPTEVYRADYPNPFPGSKLQVTGCQPPPGWTGK